MKIERVLPISADDLKKKLLRDGLFPVFIVGVPRSGTTALARSLQEHSQIVIAPGESPLAHWFGKTAHRYAVGNNSRFYQKYTAISEDIFRSALRNLCLDCIWTREDRLALIARKDGDPDEDKVRIWGTKAFPDQEAAQGLAWLFPSTKFIYVYRNGIDVVFSMSKFHSFRDMPFPERCQFWAGHALRYDYLRHATNTLAVQFEKFVFHPESVIRSIFDHLGVPLEEAALRFASEWLIHPLDQDTIRGNPKEILSSRPPAHLSWSDSERETFRNICGDAMSLLNYTIPF